MFEIERKFLSASFFNVSVQISGITNILLLTVRYIGIDPTFPHHLNSFDNVPVQYGSSLVNITSQTGSANTYTNIINYKTQTSNKNTFSTPFENNKILLFLTSMFLTGTNDNTGTANPVTFRVTATIID